ncbi:MAG: cell division suppressor protein YneA [Bacillota bacterium]|jgi:hypothetical protein
MQKKFKVRWNRVLILIITLVFCMSFGVNAFGETQGAEKYIDVKVQTGDSIWQLVQEYNPEYTGNMSKAVYEVKEINNLQSSCLLKGQVLRIPLDL